MLLDSQLADVCAGTYDPTYIFDQVWTGDTTNDVWVGLKRLSGFDIVAFRGSEITKDWFRDIVTDLYLHPILGGVHHGFSLGLDETYDRLLPNLKQPLIIVGHSLGAARALLFAALLTARGIPVARVMTCGSPRPALARVAEILLPVAVYSYKNRYDPVTLVPVPAIGLNYVHPRTMIKVNAAPPLDDFEPLADHHIYLYQKGIKDFESLT